MKLTHAGSRDEWLAVRLGVMLSTYRFLDLTPRGRQRYINDRPWNDTYGVRDRHEHHH